MTQAQLQTYIATFTLTSTGVSDEPGTSDIKRKMLAHFVNVGTAEKPEWELLGYKQESAAVASNYDTTDVTDVTGESYTDINSKLEKLEMSEYKINPNQTKFLAEAIKLKAIDAEEQMQDYQILTVYGFLRNTDGACMAYKEDGCSLVLDNLGGQGYTLSDVAFTLSGRKIFGTVAEIQRIGTTFTEYKPA
ncbi:MAG: hypothetical protein HFE78_08510 [Clostridiales bacterium]|nr:hypothetical protein [Clostridiales bacterium]